MDTVVRRQASSMVTYERRGGVGRKDTVVVRPGETVPLLMRFEEFADAAGRTCSIATSSSTKTRE